MKYARKSSGYPVGATWEATTDEGKRGKIWLQKIDGRLEVWRWSLCFSDGSGSETDWQPTKAGCRREIIIYNRSGKPVIFRRTK